LKINKIKFCAVVLEAKLDWYGGDNVDSSEASENKAARECQQEWGSWEGAASPFPSARGWGSAAAPAPKSGK